MTRIVSLTTEFTIWKAGKGYLVELDGEPLYEADNLAAARAYITRYAKKHDIEGAGLTEVFGRNLQLVQGPRGGWTRFKGTP